MAFLNKGNICFVQYGYQLKGVNKNNNNNSSIQLDDAVQKLPLVLVMVVIGSGIF